MREIKIQTEEQKGGLVKMNNWENILKAARDRKGKLSGGKEIPEKVMSNRIKRPSQTRIKGGNPADDLNPEGRMDDIDLTFEEEDSMEEELAEMTRTDLMDAVMERIAEMSRKELIRILSRTSGKLEEAL